MPPDREHLDCTRPRRLEPRPPRPGAAGRGLAHRAPAELSYRTVEGEFVERERARRGGRAPPRRRAIRTGSSPGSSGCGRRARARTIRCSRGSPSSATPRELRWFLCQEVAGEAGFDDLVALTQVKAPERAKLELARNYWDEMGRGRAEGMHGRMLEEPRARGGRDARRRRPSCGSRSRSGTSSSRSPRTAATPSRRSARSGVDRAHRAGARAVSSIAGLRRARGIAARPRYFALHATLDVKHSEAWNREVFARSSPSARRSRGPSPKARSCGSKRARAASSATAASSGSPSRRRRREPAQAGEARRVLAHEPRPDVGAIAHVRDHDSPARRTPRAAPLGGRAAADATST